MKTIGVVLTVALAVVVSVCHGQQSSTRTWRVASYLEHYIRNDWDGPAFDWIKAILEEKNLSQPEEILAFFKETLKTVEMENEPTVQYNGNIIRVEAQVRELIQLADNNESNVPVNTVHNYIRLVQHVFGDVEVMSKSSPPSHDVGLFNYLRVYGMKQFTSAANNFNSYLEQLVKNSRKDPEMVLDDLVLSQEDDKKSTSKDDKYLTQLASNVDLVAGQLDAKKLVKAAKHHVKKDAIYKNGYFVFEIIGGYCRLFRDNFNYLLSVFNMIRLLSPESLSEVNIPDKLLKFNEYARICHQRSNKLTSFEVFENIEKKLEGPLSKMVKKTFHSS